MFDDNIKNGTNNLFLKLISFKVGTQGEAAVCII